MVAGENLATQKGCGVSVDLSSGSRLPFFYFAMVAGKELAEAIHIGLRHEAITQHAAKERWPRDVVTLAELGETIHRDGMICRR